MPMKKRATRRVALLKVDVLTVQDEGRARTQAKVVLALGGRSFIGRVFIPADDDELLGSIALATLEALSSALPEPVSFELKKAAKIYPKFLSDPLLIVMIDCHYKDLDLDLTGACIAKDEKMAVGIASATLDATNRVVSFLLDLRETNERTDNT
jgi:hypothetical protein